MPLPKEPSADPIKDGLLNRLLNLTAPEKVETPVIPDEPVVKTDEPVVPPEVVVETPKPVRVVKRTSEEKPITKADLEEVFTKHKPEPAKPVEVKPEPAPEDDLSGLLEEERSEVDLAKYAETKNPDKFKGLGTKFTKFFKENKAKLESMAADDASFNPAEDSDYQAWLKANRPKLTRTERDQLFSQKIKDDTIAELSTKHKAELDEIRRDVKSTRVQPEIDRRASETEASVLEGLPEEVLAFHKANGNDLAKTAAEYPLEC